MVSLHIVKQQNSVLSKRVGVPTPAPPCAYHTQCPCAQPLFHLKDNKGHHLKGIHPDKYNGDQSQMMRFLNTFNRFMLMNYKADIAKDPIM